MKATINGLDAYMGEDAIPAVSLSVNSLEDPSKVGGTATTTFKVIMTKEAARAIGKQFLSGKQFTNRPTLEIEGSGDTGLSMEVAVMSVDRDVVECVAVGGNASWFEWAKSIKLKEYPWRLGPSVNGPDILSSWTSGLVYFPLVDYGAFEGQDETYDVGLAQIRPGFRIFTCLTELFEAEGWTFRASGVRANNEIDKFIHLEDGEKATVSVTDPKIQFYDPVSRQYSYVQYDEIPNAIAFDNTGFLNPDDWSPLTFRQTVRQEGNVRVSFNLTIPYPDDPDYDGLRFRVVLVDHTDQVVIGGIESDAVVFFADGVIEFSGELGPFYVLEGHEVYLGIQVSGPVTEETGDGIDGDCQYSFSSDYQELGKVEIGSIMPPWTLAELVKNFFTAQQYVPVTDAANKIIDVWAVEEYFRKPSTGGAYRDWTTRMDHTVAPRRKVDALPRVAELRYKEGGDDRHLKRMERVSNGTHANASVNLPRGIKDTQVTTLAWSATFMDTVFDGVTIPVIRNDGGAIGEDDYSHTSRILVADGTASGNWKILGTDLTYYPKCYFVQKGAEGIAMAFDNPLQFGGGQPKMIENQWAHRVRMWRESDLLEANLFIRDTEIKDFDFGLPTLIDDGAGPEWVWVQEIKQHRFGVNKPTQCVLVRIPVAEVDTAEITQPSVIYPPQPFLCVGPGYVSFLVTSGGTGSTYIETNSGFYAVRNSSGVTVHASETTASGLGPGSYCLWPCDSDGVKTGNFSGITIGPGDITDIVLDGAESASLLRVVITGTDINALDLPSNLPNMFLLHAINNASLVDLTLPTTHALGYLFISGNAISEASVDAVAVNIASKTVTAGTLYIAGGTTSAPSATGLAAIATLEAPPTMSISGTGNANVDGDYDEDGTQNGKSRYLHATNGITEVYWTGAQWRILAVNAIFDSYDAVAQPWLATTWTLVSGTGSLPTVNPPGLDWTVTTN